MSKNQKHFMEAVSFAARKHRGQFRKDKKTPYVSHTFRTCLVLRHLFGIQDERMLVTALLHDVLEDTSTSLATLRKKFGNQITCWIKLLSKDKRLPKRIRETTYLKTLKKAPLSVKMIKLADVYDNLSDASFFGKKFYQKTVKKAERLLAVFQHDKRKALKRPLRLVEERLLWKR